MHMAKKITKSTPKKAPLKKNAPKTWFTTQKLLVILIVLLVVAVAVGGWLTYSQHKYRNFSGTVTKIGLEGSAFDAPVYYQVRVSDKNIQDIYLTVAPTPEHPDGTPLPNVKVGDKVTVHAAKGADGASLVGSKDTYIKRQE